MKQMTNSPALPPPSGGGRGAKPLSHALLYKFVLLLACTHLAWSGLKNSRMEPLYMYLKEKPSTHVYYHPHQYLYLTSTKNQTRTYLLALENIKPFLQTYVNAIPSQPQLHVQLQALEVHALCINFNYTQPHDRTSLNDDPQDARHVYNDIVKELTEEMIIEGGKERDSHLHAYCLTRTGSPNFHLIFPFLYLNRLDYHLLVSRLVPWKTNIDVAHGWVMYKSKKTPTQSIYDVVCLYHGERRCSRMELVVSLSARYPKKCNDYIYSHLLFPARLPEFKPCHLATYPIRMTTQPLPPPACLILKYVDQTMTYLYGLGKSQTSACDALFTEPVLAWCKSHVNQYSFQDMLKVVKYHLKKLYPPRNQQRCSNLKALFGTPLIHVLESAWRALPESLQHAHDTDCLLSVMTNYTTSYYPVVPKIVGNDPASPYTIHSVLYELAYRDGVSLLSFKDVRLSKTLLDGLSHIYFSNSLPDFHRHLGIILQTIPYGIHTKKIHVFNWETRDWKTRMTVQLFARLMTHALLKTMLALIKDPDVKRDCAKRRQQYLGSSKEVEAVLLGSANLTFDTNSRVCGLANGHVLSGPCFRLTIPQDKVWRTLGFSFEYPQEDLFTVFRNQDAYRSAFQHLKAQVTMDPTSIDAFRATGHEAIDLLLSYFLLFFGEKYGELHSFLSYLVDALMGRCESPHRILCLIGGQHQGKNTLAKLLDLTLADYQVHLKPHLFTCTKNRSGKRVRSEMVRHPGCRLWIASDVTQPLNSDLLQSLLITPDPLSRTDLEVEPPHFLFTMKQYPTILMIPALLPRFQMLTCQSTFLSSVDRYDFASRIFPARLHLDLPRLGSPFTSLIIHLMRQIHAAKALLPTPPR